MKRREVSIFTSEITHGFSFMRRKIGAFQNSSFTFDFIDLFFIFRMNLTKVFVYGTLKKGEPNHKTLSETAGLYKFVSEGTTIQKYPLIIATKFNIPFLLNDPEKGHRIEGEIYEVDQEKLMTLDDLEAYPTLYDRKVEMIELKGRNEHVEAYVYLLRKWNEKIFEGATEMLESYASLGPHGRPYVDR
ncbi:hypothetical protein WR25_23942 isoform A [Diploscapter pachys]|uniref:Gamma-glutamylcyclotransferase family protein n=1 Tax=Diploscapter pachys TaxID=2018661 RepID=A0A2A2J9U9_9BILA|nr:hypothetical protein WR25_23942 isoform A [Diploscapter pachys]